MTSCEDVRENLSAYADNQLDINERMSFEEHINNCPACKKELEDMLRIISTCNELPQRELPIGFKAELHEKLTAVSNGQKNLHVVPNKPKKVRYARTLASIAAGILLIFLGGSIVRFAFFSEEFSAKNAESYDMTAQAPSEATAETPALASESAEEGALYSMDANSDNDGMESSETAAETAGGSAGMSNGAEEFEKPMEAPARSFAVALPETMEAHDETLNNKSSTITILAEDPTAALESVNSLAKAHNEINQTRKQNYSGLQDTASIAEAPADTEDDTGAQIQLQFVFSQADYSAFTAALNDKFGTADVQRGALVSEDMADASANSDSVTVTLYINNK